MAKAADVEVKEGQPSSEHTNRQNSESKAEKKTDAAQNGENSVSKLKNEAKGKSLKAAGSSSEDKVDSVAAADEMNADEIPILHLCRICPRPKKVRLKTGDSVNLQTTDSGNKT